MRTILDLPSTGRRYEGDEMTRARWIALVLPALLVAVAPLSAAPSDKPAYVKKATRVKTILSSLRANGLPTLEGMWYYIGPFDNTENAGFDTAYPPEREIDLARTYEGKDDQKVGWKEMSDFKVGQ